MVRRCIKRQAAPEIGGAGISRRIDDPLRGNHRRSVSSGIGEYVAAGSYFEPEPEPEPEPEVDPEPELPPEAPEEPDEPMPPDPPEELELPGEPLAPEL